MLIYENIVEDARVKPLEAIWNSFQLLRQKMDYLEIKFLSHRHLAVIMARNQGAKYNMIDNDLVMNRCCGSRPFNLQKYQIIVCLYKKL